MGDVRSRQVSQAEAMLWLSERIGRTVFVTVRATREIFLVAEGTLRHWRYIEGANRPRVWDDDAGFYVGESTAFTIGVPDADPAPSFKVSNPTILDPVDQFEREQLSVSFAEGAFVNVVVIDDQEAA